MAKSLRYTFNQKFSSMQKIKVVFKECNAHLYMTHNNDLVYFLSFKRPLITVGLNKSKPAIRNLSATSAMVSQPENKVNPAASYGTYKKLCFQKSRGKGTVWF